MRYMGNPIIAYDDITMNDGNAVYKREKNIDTPRGKQAGLVCLVLPCLQEEVLSN